MLNFNSLDDLSIQVVDREGNKDNLYLVKYENIENKNPKYLGQTCLLDCRHNLTFWGVDNKVYACIG